ncbi:MAG: choice-of-anchor D domain-containing protein [Bacteriodetes bacterium]|nr:choice-of-anchor D domain-containing protein [Bacteroidota bacterium]
MNRFASKFLLLTMAVFTILTLSLRAGTGDNDVNMQDIRNKLSEALANGGSAGTEFYFSVPPCYEVGGTSAINLYVACPVKTKVTVEVEGRGFLVVRQTVANDIIEIRLNPGTAQAFSKTDAEGIPAEQIWPQAAIHVKSQAPIVCYVSIRFPYTSDTFLAIPLQALGKEYIVASMADMTWMYGGYSLPSITTITAAYDNTKVSFTLGGNAVTVTSGGMKAGQTKTWNMMRGDVVVIGNSKDSKEGDMSGSKIVASKPVAVTSGNQCANVPTTLRWCDYIAEQEIPTNVWGKTLLVPRFSTRKNSAMIKIFAKDPNTQMFKNGSPNKVIQKAGGVEGTGFIYERVNANANTIMVYSGNKPISATFFNTGQEDDNVVSDPFQMDIYPIEQFQKEIIFCTPGIKGGFKFDFNYLNVVYQLTDQGTIPDDLEFGTAVNGVIKWQPLRSVFGPSIGDVFPIKVNGKTYASKECILPGDNVYRMRCSLPFACYSYGVSNYDSYGHPTSAAFVVLGDTVVPNPTWTENCTGNVTDGLIYDYPNDDSIRSNMSTIILDPSLSKNYTLDYEPFVAGENRQVKWQLKVDNPEEDAVAVVHFTDRAGNDTTITVKYQAVKLTIQGKEIDFGTLKKGTKDTRDVTITNDGSSTLTIKRIELKNGGNGVFTILNNPVPFTLDPKQSKTITIEYFGKNDGIVRDTLVVGDDLATNCFERVKPIVGQTDVPIIVVEDVIFPTTVKGSTAPSKKTIVKNIGGAALNITGRTQQLDANIAGFSFDPTVFNIDKVPSPSTASPLVINAGKEESYDITMNTDKLGKFAAKVIFSSDASTIDSILIIQGEITEPGLATNIVEFGRRHWKPAPAYSTDKNNVTAQVYLTNTGNADVNVRNAKPNPVDFATSQYFNIDLTKFVGTIKPGDTVWVPVTYSPQQFGDHKFDITYESDAPNSPTTTVTGTGIVAQLVWADVTFTLNKVGTPDTKPFTLRNKTLAEHPYGDVATIEDFLETSAVTGGISEDATIYGQQDMAYDKKALTFPIKLAPGQDLTLTAMFQPIDQANKSGQLTTKSDAEVEVKSNWNGSAYLNDVPKPPAIIPDTKTICLGDQGTVLTFKVSNPGDVDYTTLDIAITGTGASQFGTPSFDATKLPLKKGQSVDVTVTFNPTTTGTHTITFTATANGNAALSTGIQASAIANQYTPKFKVIGNANVANGKLGTISESDGAPVAVRLDASADGTFATDLTFVLHYDINVMRPILSGQGNNQAKFEFEPSGAMSSWSLVDATIDDKNGDITIHVKGNSPLTGAVGKDLFRLYFTFGLPPAEQQYKKDALDAIITKEVTLQVSKWLNAGGTKDNCMAPTTEGDICKIQSVCSYDLRHVNIAATAFGMVRINPNPVTSSGTELHFGVAFTNQTTIDLINSNGDVVSTLVNEELKAGSYTLQLNPTNLASGVYTLRMTSGYFTQTQQVVVTK